MNLQLFETKNINKKHNYIKPENFPFFLSCRKCNNAPEVILKDNLFIIITCPNYNIIENENIQNFSNYSSCWIANELKNFCSLNHNEKTVSSIYCRICDNYICNECLKNHHHRNKNYDELIKIKDLKIGYCNHHNKKFSYYCNDCKSELCIECKNSHIHKDIQISSSDYLDYNKFEKFLEKAEKIKKKKYSIISETKTVLESIFTEDRESYKLLNNTISDIIKEFCKDLKNEQNLIFFAEILLITIKKINNYNDFRVKQYKQILEVIYGLFKSKEVEKFREFISKKIFIYKTYINKLSNAEKESIKRNTKNILNIHKEDCFQKIKEFIENVMYLSNPLKKYIMIDKIKNLNSYINIDETINNPNNMTKKINSKDNSNFILSILSKFFEQKGIDVYVSTEKDEQFKNIEIASFLSLIYLGNLKKYELWLDFGEEQNNNLIYIPEEKDNFIKNYKFIISKILDIHPEDLILIYKELNPNSIVLNMSIINETNGVNENILKLDKIDFIKKVEEKPILDTIQINPELLDKRLDKIWKKNKNEKRGGYDYIQPQKDWIGIGLNAYDKYDDGNNTWLDFRNIDGEYAVAYSGLNITFIYENNFSANIKAEGNNNNIFIDYLFPFNTIGSIFNSIFISNKNDVLLEKSVKNIKLCLFQNPKLAENKAGIINIFGYKIMIMLMFRVNPKKIVKSENSPEAWIFNPASDEIRPYRILLKIIPSLLTDRINISFSPINYILSAFKSKNISFYDLAKDKRFKEINQLNKQNLNNDFFVMRFYSSNYYKYLNNYLRSENSLKENNQLFDRNNLTSWIYCLQLALKRNKNVKDNIIVYRGISRFKFRKDVKKGTEFYFREFISTSLDKNVAKSFVGNYGTLLIINIINNGSNGFPNYCYNLKDISMYPSEDEILISSHCCFEVSEINKNKKIDEVYLTCKGFNMK